MFDRTTYVCLWNTGINISICLIKCPNIVSVSTKSVPLYVTYILSYKVLYSLVETINPFPVNEIALSSRCVRSVAICLLCFIPVMHYLGALLFTGLTASSLLCSRGSAQAGPTAGNPSNDGLAIELHSGTYPPA